MDQAARMELVQDPDLRTSIGNAIKDNRKAIYTEALKQMQKQKMERVTALGSPTRLALHKASFEVMHAAVAHFDGRMRLNNQLTDIVTPKLKQAEQERHKQSKEYKEEQTFLKLMRDHQKMMAKRRKDKEQREANEIANDKEKNIAEKADQKSVKKQQSKGADDGSNIVQTVKEPLVLPDSQSQCPTNKIQESSKKEAPKVDLPSVNKEKSNLFKVQQTPEDRKTNPLLTSMSTSKPGQQSKTGNQPTAPQKKTENIFTAVANAGQKAGGIFGNATGGLAALGPKLFQSDKPTTNTQKPPSSLFGSGPTSGIFDGTKPVVNPTSIFETKVDQNPSNLFGDLGKTNTASNTNPFLSQPKKGQNEGEGNSNFAGLFTKTDKASQNLFSGGKKNESNFSKGLSGNQRITPSIFDVGSSNKKGSQPIDASLDNVLTSKDYSVSGNAK